MSVPLSRSTTAQKLKPTRSLVRDVALERLAALLDGMQVGEHEGAKAEPPRLERQWHQSRRGMRTGGNFGYARRAASTCWRTPPTSMPR